MRIDNGVNNQKESSSFLSELGWLVAGFVLPVTSLHFYRQVTRRKANYAILFFILFTIIISTLEIIRLGSRLNKVSDIINNSFESGDIPEIMIQDGIATVKAAEPFIVMDDDRTAIIFDTTGQYTRLDTARFTDGMLLTRTSLHILNKDGNYTELPLIKLNRVLRQNPLVINAETATRTTSAISRVIVMFGYLALIIWNTLFRFMFILGVGLLLRGLISMVRPNTSFSPILITGLYALVPSVYIYYLIALVSVNFTGLLTILLLLIWALVLKLSIQETGITVASHA